MKTGKTTLFNMKPIVIKFSTMKECSQVYKIPLTNIKDCVMLMTEKKALREAKLELMQLLSVIEVKEARLYAGETI